MLVSTYQHDYVSPFTKRYDFLKNCKQEAKKEECSKCIDTATMEPKTAVAKCAEAGAEWTGIAPMGRLIDPRIIPTKLAPGQAENMANNTNMDCSKMQPNRFLQILRTAYPDLYERLKEMPKDELGRRLERQRLFTTYQIDYCAMNEYPEGIYKSLSKKNDVALTNNKLLKRQDPCDEFRANVMKELNNQVTRAGDPCIKAHKPFKISFSDGSRFINAGNNSHWRSNVFAKKVDLSEYVDTINRNGCIIMKNNIHDHSKCNNGKHCRHELVRTCANIE